MASPQLLPTTPINVPKLTAADVHLRYHADHVEGRSVPFDTFAAKLDIVDGRIAVHPLTLGVGEGHIVGDIDLAPARRQGEFHTRSDVKFERVDVGRMLAATHLVHGAGLLGGEATWTAPVTRWRAWSGTAMAARSCCCPAATCRRCWSICRAWNSATPSCPHSGCRPARRCNASPWT